MTDYPYINIHTHFGVSDDELTISCVGIHPWSASKCHFDDDTKRELAQALTCADALGEVGLDYAADVDRDAQAQLFISQLKLAKKLGKCVVLHCVRAFEPTMDLLERFSLRGVIFHGFIGSVQQMNQAIERGYYISFGSRTFDSPKTVKALREAPLDRLFFETDMSEDVDIEEIYERASKHRVEGLPELRAALYDNYKRLFPDKL